MKITFGLCVKNSEKTIRSAIDSIARQDYPHEDMEIIVVDGNSTDATLDVAKGIISKIDIRSMVLSDRGRGLGAARQMVVDRSSGEYIIYLGADVTLPKDFLRKQTDFMGKNPRAGAAIPESEYTRSEKKLVASVQNLLFSVVKNLSNGTIFRTRALKEVKGFDLNIKGASEDREVMFRISLAGWRIVVNSNAKFYHGRGETLKDVYLRYFWYGYGDHFTNHKHRNLYKVPYYLPPSYFVWGLKLSFKAYNKYHEKKSFFIPFFCLLASISWCMGLASSHSDGYGHSIQGGKPTIGSALT